MPAWNDAVFTPTPFLRFKENGKFTDKLLEFFNSNCHVNVAIKLKTL